MKNPIEPYPKWDPSQAQDDVKAPLLKGAVGEADWGIQIVICIRNKLNPSTAGAVPLPLTREAISVNKCSAVRDLPARNRKKILRRLRMTYHLIGEALKPR